MPGNIFGHEMRREKLQHLVKTEMIEGKHSREKQREKMLDWQTKWLIVGRLTEALKAMRDRDLWKVMISYSKEHGTQLNDWSENKCSQSNFKSLTNSVKKNHSFKNKWYLIKGWHAFDQSAASQIIFFL